jgi:hypothetical protein
MENKNLFTRKVTIILIIVTLVYMGLSFTTIEEDHARIIAMMKNPQLRTIIK